MSTRTASSLLRADTTTAHEELGETLARRVLAELGADPPPVVLGIAFVSPELSSPAFTRGIHQTLGDMPLVGCSTAGEFTASGAGEGGATLMLVASDSIRVSVGLGRNLRHSSQEAVTQVFSALRVARGNATREYPHRTLLVLADGLAGRGEELVDRLALEAGPRCVLVGGAAGDGGRFRDTTVFLDGQVYRDAVVVAEFLSRVPFGVGVAHGWTPTRFQRRVTRVAGNTVLELDDQPAVSIYEEYARDCGIKLGPADLNWFMMTHELGIDMPNGEIKVRAPLSATAEGGIVCATEIPLGKVVSIVEGHKADLLAAAGLATRRAVAMIGSSSAAGVVVFDCVARKANLSQDFHEEVEVIRGECGEAPVIGFNTYGEIARIKGQLSGFHNTTDVVLVIPAA